MDRIDSYRCHNALCLFSLKSLVPIGTHSAGAVKHLLTKSDTTAVLQPLSTVGDSEAGRAITTLAPGPIESNSAERLKLDRGNPPLPRVSCQGYFAPLPSLPRCRL